MSHRKLTEAEFLKDVAEHRLEILHDDGVYRHIRLKKPGSGCMHFDLVTWPGYLAYSGDMGCYVFSRARDMFTFFRTDDSFRARYPDRTLFPNLPYWAEKLQATDSNGRHSEGATEFSEEKFNRAVLGDLVSWIRDHRNDTTPEERRALWEEVMHEVIDADRDGGGYRKQCAAHDFRHKIREGFYFRFYDFGEHTVTDYRVHFVWCCYALSWGIAQYDKAVAKAREQEGGAA